MSKTKVLIVDDSAVIRKVLGDLISEDVDLEVIGTASNGKIALQQIEALNPDVITLDIEMPEMDGLQTVQEIRRRGISTPIIMCSSLTADGASHTLDALAFGASDYVTKPSSHGVNTRQVVGEELLRKIKGLAGPRRDDGAPTRTSPAAGKARSTTIIEVAEQQERLGSADAKAGAIAIGVSTGGPNALQVILPMLPSVIDVPVFIVQHMPPLFTKLLAERLSAVSKIPVVEAQHAQEVKGGQIYLAPGGFHMEVKRLLGRVSIALHEGEPENSCRPAVDVLFRSIAAVYGSSARAVMLTGMGQDGLKGCQRIHQAGGVIVAQDRETSAVWGMPGAVVEAGLASAVIPLGEVAEFISRGGPAKPHGSQASHEVRAGT